MRKTLLAIVAMTILTACSTTTTTTADGTERQRRDPFCPPATCSVYDEPSDTDRQNQRDERDRARTPQPN